MTSSHLILCRPLLLLPSVFPSIRVFSSESVLCIRWPKDWRFSFSISPSSEYSGLICFSMDWFALLDLCIEHISSLSDSFAVENSRSLRSVPCAESQALLYYLLHTHTHAHICISVHVNPGLLPCRPTVSSASVSLLLWLKPLSHSVVCKAGLFRLCPDPIRV